MGLVGFFLQFGLNAENLSTLNEESDLFIWMLPSGTEAFLG